MAHNARCLSIAWEVVKKEMEYYGVNEDARNKLVEKSYKEAVKSGNSMTRKNGHARSYDGGTDTSNESRRYWRNKEGQKRYRTSKLIYGDR